MLHTQAWEGESPSGVQPQGMHIAGDSFLAYQYQLVARLAAPAAAEFFTVRASG